MQNESHTTKHVVTFVLHSFIRIAENDYDGWMTRPDKESKDVLLLLKPGSAKFKVGETLAVSTIARFVPLHGTEVVIARLN